MPSPGAPSGFVERVKLFREKVFKSPPVCLHLLSGQLTGKGGSCSVLINAVPSLGSVTPPHWLQIVTEWDFLYLPLTTLKWFQRNKVHTWIWVTGHSHRIRCPGSHFLCGILSHHIRPVQIASTLKQGSILFMAGWPALSWFSLQRIFQEGEHGTFVNFLWGTA